MQYKWVALTVTTIGVLMAGIDTRVVIIGLPSVARALNTDVEPLIWVTQSYLLASTAGLLLIGRVTDLFGRVKIYNVGFSIFTIGSALSGLAPNVFYLIAARAVQGVGSSMLITNSAAILTDSSPRNELGFFLGINQIAFRVGSIVGLTLSGVILALADWRFLFYINVPIGIFGTIWAHVRLREIVRLEKTKRIDLPGFFTFTLGVTSLLLGITFSTYGGVSLVQASFLYSAGTILLVAFFFLERRTLYPILDLNLFKIKEYAFGNLALVLNAVSWGAMTLIISFYLQRVKGYSPLAAGIGILPLEATYIIAGPLSGKLSDKFGARGFSTIGLGIGSVALVSLAFVNESTDYLYIATSLAIMGIGMGMFVSPNISSIMGSLPPERRGIGSAFRATIFNIGLTSSLGLAILVISFGIPYGALSSVIALGTGGSNIDKVEFINGLDKAFLVMGIVNAVAIIPSAFRGRRSSFEKKMARTEKRLEKQKE